MYNLNRAGLKNKIRLRNIFLVFFKIGFIAFGPAMMMEAKKNIVKKLNWIDEKEFLDGLALAQLLPGATFVSLTIYIGYKLKGLLGAVASFIGFILPPFLIMVLLSWLYFKYQSITFVNVLFKGMGAVVVAIILNAVWDMAKIITNNIRSIIIAAISFIISLYYNNVFLILLIAAFLGIALLRKKTNIKDNNLTDKTKLHPKDMRWKDIIIICISIGLFLASTSFVNKLLRITGVFFKIGALVFGNGFTMLPLIQHEVVNVHHWLNLTDFLVGVALGQMTPGPIVITATFIGYKVMGFLGALVATLAIFTPSFLLVVTTFGIYSKIKNNKWVSSALNGLIASFVGLMFIVVINTGRHALVDVYTTGLSVLSFIMLQFIKLDSKWVILSGSGIYLAVYYLIHYLR